MEYLYLIGGLILLVVSGNYLVESAVGIAKKFRLSSLVIGMTIVAFGTSAPELVVSVQAAISGHPEIALGNVVGSNIANIGLIMGLTAIIFPVFASSRSMKVDWTFLMIISILFVIAAWNGFFSRLDGIIAVSLLILFTIWSIYSQKNEKESKKEVEKAQKHILINLLIFTISCVGLTFGADFLVKGASTLALKLGLSERVVSVVIVGVGTSLPELTASLIAAVKKEDGITLGNIIGSNIFNVLGVLGLTGIVKPIVFSATEFRSDFLWMLGFTFLLFIGMLNITENHKKYSESKNLLHLIHTQKGLIGRIWGFFALALYVFYVVQLFI